MVIIVMSVVLSSLVVNVGKGKPGRRAPRWLVVVSVSRKDPLEFQFKVNFIIISLGTGLKLTPYADF